jgi:eight-cysteine-cluster-containing protein
LTGSGCIRTGCSGHVCTDASNGPLISTCEWREEYACYKTAKCEKQSNGQCGWTPSESLQGCLKAAGAR